MTKQGYRNILIKEFNTGITIIYNATMNNKYYEYLVVTAEEKNISKAAKRLEISQPLLSQAIQKIENEMDCMIFDRSTSPMKLTEAGRVVVDKSRCIVINQREMRTKLAEMKNSQAGTLTVGASPFRSTYMMPAVIREFKKHYPNVKVILKEEKVSVLWEMAAEGELDMAISTVPVDEKIFDLRKMQSEEIVLAVPEEMKINEYLVRENLLYKEERKRFPSVDMKDIKSIDFITLGRGQYMGDFFEEMCRKADIEPDEVIICKNIASAYAMVRAGIGATIIPSSMIQYEKMDGRVKFYSIRQAKSKREIAVIYRKGQYMTRYAEEMVKLLAENRKDM